MFRRGVAGVFREVRGTGLRSVPVVFLSYIELRRVLAEGGREGQVVVVCLSRFRRVSGFAECPKEEEREEGRDRSSKRACGGRGFEEVVRASQSARRNYKGETGLRKRACRVLVRGGRFV